MNKREIKNAASGLLDQAATMLIEELMIDELNCSDVVWDEEDVEQLEAILVKAMDAARRTLR